jgi:hypothetical protein
MQWWRRRDLLVLAGARKKRTRDGEGETVWGVFLFLRVAGEAEWEATSERPRETDACVKVFPKKSSGV